MNLNTTIDLQGSVHKRNKLTVMVGVPGSGKSTKVAQLAAKNPEAVVLARDTMRGELLSANESQLTQNMWSAAMSALEAGKDVIVDSPNMDKDDKPAWERIAAKHKAELQFIHMNTPYGVAINRDAKREHPVGQDKIKSMLGDK